ncbi:MAG: hypothetical protein GX595_10160 [Lentisphaerae bacterium]|nr:hypothetical protein [Lentisphaerota bacterium]
MTVSGPARRGVGATCLLLALIMLATLLALLMVQHRQARHQEAARAAFEDDAVRVTSVWTYRAPVCDRYGAPLNVTTDEYALAIQPSALRDIRNTRRQTLDLVEAEMARLAIDLWPRQAQIRRVPREDIEAHLMQASPMPLILWRDLDSETLQRWLLARRRYPSVELVRLPRRLYHLPDLAPLTRGRVYLTRRGSTPNDRDCDFPDLTMAGWLGAERWRDQDLAGQPGLERLFLDAVLFRQRALRSADPVIGRPVALTLDMNVQRWAQEAMEGLSGALVVMSSDGDLLALADAEGTAAPLSLSDPHERWQGLLRDRRQSDLCRCLADATAPGSTIKPMVALAALQAGVITPETRLRCTGAFHYGADAAIRCNSLVGHGEIDLYRALGSSCNVYFLELAARLGREPLEAMLRSVGLAQLPGEGFGPGSPTASPLDGPASRGVIDSPEWKRANYRARVDQVWRPIDTGFMAIGQANTRMTPLQAAVMANAVATGRRVRPRLYLDEPHWAVPLTVSPAARAAVMQGLREVVHHPRGTGRYARVEGMTLAGKTGTAQVGSPRAPRNDVWMIVMYPGYADEVRLVIAAMAHDQSSGGRDLGERLGHLAQRLQEWETWNDERRRQWPDGVNAGSVAGLAPGP